MRRKDREVSDAGKIRDIVAACHYCRLGFYDQGEIYIVPMNFGYLEEEDRRTFYFHGAKAGRRADLVQQRPRVGFEMDRGYELIVGEEPCQYSAKFQSIVGTGEIHPVEDSLEKKRALQLIMAHNTGKSDWDFKDSMLESVLVFKLEVEKMSCKEHL